MAVLSQSPLDSVMHGNLLIKTGIGTLVSGACVVPVGGSTVLFAVASPIHATTAVAVQTITATGLTIPTNGFAKTTDNSNSVEFKSNEGASTIQFQYLIMYYP